MRHRLHSLCPYFAMFPESFPREHILGETDPGDLVFDPFSGRGTTVFESLQNGRRAAGTDVNRVAACIGGAKAEPPTLRSVVARLNTLEKAAREATSTLKPESEFFSVCFNSVVLRNLAFLRTALRWETSRVDRFIAALVLGALHGESHKSPNYFSNRMPRTISTKPDYSVRWWKARELHPPERHVFDILRRMATFRLSRNLPSIRGTVKLRDAREASAAFPSLHGNVKLIVTSPPYLNTTDYAEDQWLRLWFLGGPERPKTKVNKDDRHLTTLGYGEFLKQVWRGCELLLADKAAIVVRIGGSTMDREELFQLLGTSLCEGLPKYKIEPDGVGITTLIVNSQIKTFRPGLIRPRYEHDYIFRAQVR